MPKLARENEDVEDALRLVWTKRVGDSTGQANQQQFSTILSDALKKLSIAPPNAEWYTAAFQNFDLDKDGWISKSDVADICVQYVNAYLKLNTKTSSSVGSSKPKSKHNVDGGGTDGKSFSKWL
ncbi:unnamed protein product, partial [Amoebophrya sp. A25]|eukprot:GSA25T00024426001.1